MPKLFVLSLPPGKMKQICKSSLQDFSLMTKEKANGVLSFSLYIVFTTNEYAADITHILICALYSFNWSSLLAWLKRKKKHHTCIRNSFRSSLKGGFCLKIHSVSANQKECPLTSNMCFLLVLIQKWCFIFPSKKVLLSIIFVVLIV